MRLKDKLARRSLLTLLVVILLSVLSLGNTFVFADGTIDEDDNWWNFRNSDDNNAVTDRPTPTNDKEAWGKWATKFNGDYTQGSPTPPIIVQGRMFVACGTRVVEINKENGEIVRYSEEMPANVGYAMHSPVYAEGKIFVAISLGRICAVNLDDLSVAWTTDNTGIIRGQTVSPISYKKINGKGYVYTGTWTNSGGDLICATTDDSNVTINSENQKIKALTWNFNPGIEDKDNLEAHDSVAVGYYWTGAYVTEKYLAIGSDNGSELGDVVNDTAFYTLNPLTGDIIDVIYGIKGQVRSTAVFKDGYLYFSTKGAKIYKIKVDEEGHLSNASYIDMRQYGALMATATPVVYGGRIYLGVQGEGGQFSADGGHGFVVVKDDPVLSQSSFIYNIPVPGYPQAGALLSTYHEDEDFDGDDKADGRVYLFFTYNAPPGGIFYTYDTPTQTTPTELSVEEARIFVPTGDKQQHCISSIVVDKDGNLYFKNDSNHLFCVESNPAGINNIQIFDDSEKEISFDKDFHAKIADYSSTISGEVTRVKVKLDLMDGVEATVNGVGYTDSGVDIPITEEITTITVVASKNGKSRSYVLTLTQESSNADLKTLATSPNNTPGSFRPVDPTFDKDVLEYTFDWRPPVGSQPSWVSQERMNIYLKPENDNAVVRVFAGENTKSSGSSYYAADGSVRGIATNNNKYTLRFPIYSADVKKDSTATIEVKSQDGKVTKTYSITFSRRIYVANVTLDKTNADIHEGDKLVLTASVNPSNATNPNVEFSSSNKKVLTVDAEGNVTAVGSGTATITASSEDGPFDTCEIKVSKHNLKATKKKEATCVEEGLEAYWFCSICERYYSDQACTKEISGPVIIERSSNHKYGKWLKLNDQYHQRVCEHDKTHVEKAKHTWDSGKVTKEATETATGVKTYTCTACKTTKEEVIPKKPVSQIWYRLYGDGRYDTMKSIVDEGFTKTGGTVVMATGANYKDALAASGVAGIYKAPVVTTDGKSLSIQAKQVLGRLKPKKVIVVGGTFAVSDKVLSQIQAATGVKPNRVFGQDSCATSAKAAVSLKGKWKDNTAIIATNASFKDALSVAPISYAKGYPILLANGGKTLTKPVLDALSTIGTKHVIIVGGEGAVSKDVVKQLNKQGIKVKARLAGNTGVETSAAIARWGLKNGMTADKMGVASSQNFPDALAGASLCGANNSVLVLADDKAMANGSFPKEYNAKIKKAYVFGGESAVGPNTWKALNNSTK